MQHIDAPADGAPFRRWREEIARAILNLDIVPLGGVPFRSTVEQRLSCESVRVIQWKHTPALSVRDADMVRRGEASYTLVSPISGTLDIHQLGRELVLRPGEGVLVHNGELGRVGSSKGCNFVAVLLDQSALTASAMSDSLLRTIPRDNDGFRLLKKYVACLGNEADRLRPPLVSAAGRHVVELASLALQFGQADARDDAYGSSQDVRLAIALRFISDNFRNPDLSEHQIAFQQGISVRHLQRIFERGGFRFSNYLVQCRLTAAREALADRRQSHRKVAEIALAAGFSDISHFNRLFRRTYGANPTELRQRRS
jgi:AraC-like DNA-binding protein